MKRKLMCLSMSVAIAATATSGMAAKLSAKDAKPKPITLTMYGGTANTNDEGYKSPVAQEIKKKTGVTLKIQYAVGDNSQKLGVMLASGKLPDLVFASSDSNKFIEAKKFIKLGSLIDKYGPNIKKLYGKYYNRLQYSLKDRNIYTLPSQNVGNINWTPGIGFNLQNAVVKELGYPKLVTAKDYESAIKKYMAKHPTINGQKTIGLSLLGDDWRYYITVTNPAAEAAGIPNDGAMVVDLKTYKATGLFLSNGVKEYVKWLNHMNDIGLLDPESFIQKYDQYTAKISTGRVLGTIDASWEIADSQRALRDAKMDNRTYGQYPCVIKAGLKNADLADPGFSPSGGIGITTSCKDPVRAIKYIDYLCSEEGQILRSWGIEGKNYTIQNGKRVISASELKKRNTDSDYFKKTGVSVYNYPFPAHGQGVKDSTGQYFQPNFPETIADGYSSAEKDVLKHYGVKLWSDLYPQSSQLPERKWGAGWTITAPADSKYLLITTKIDNLEKQVIPQAIMCKPSQFEAIWSKFVKDQEKMGIHDAEKDFEKYLKQRIELWYNK